MYIYLFRIKLFDFMVLWRLGMILYVGNPLKFDVCYVGCTDWTAFAFVVIVWEVIFPAFYAAGNLIIYCFYKSGCYDIVAYHSWFYKIFLPQPWCIVGKIESLGYHNYNFIFSENQRKRKPVLFYRLQCVVPNNNSFYLTWQYYSWWNSISFRVLIIRIVRGQLDCY